MAFRLFVDSSTGVTLLPEYDYSEETTKIEDTHRTRSSKRYFYRWSKYDKITFSVQYINSSTRSLINDWWDTNQKLLFKDENAPQVYSLCLVNDVLPIGEFNIPYNDLWKGIIELEGY